MRLTLGSVQLQCVHGDIAKQPDIEAIVNAANAELMSGGGVAGAIHSAAGPALAQACAYLAPITPGKAVITEAFDLPNDFVIHCLGPVYGRDEPAAELLTQCYLRALSLADDRGIKSIAFPAISTGAFGYPFDEASQIACRAVVSRALDLRNVGLIRFVFWTVADSSAFSRVLVRAVAVAQARTSH